MWWGLLSLLFLISSQAWLIQSKPPWIGGRKARNTGSHQLTTDPARSTSTNPGNANSTRMVVTVGRDDDDDDDDDDGMETTTATTNTTTMWRPRFVCDALREQRPLYYFGIGSNMLRSKIENRGINQSKIELISMEPGYAPNYRLAFNLRGFAPLEPGMGSIEPIDSDSRPLVRYRKPECHGALILLSPDNYEKVMASEGVGSNQTNPSYEEVVVTVIPYDTSKPPVQAVALRARSHVRLRRDPCPSLRYMTILRQGAEELNLQPCYREFLNNHPVQTIPRWLQRMAIQCMIGTSTMTGSPLSWKPLRQCQRFLLSRFYVPSTMAPWRCCLSNFATAIVLLPGALMGIILQMHYRMTGKQLSPFLQRFIQTLEALEKQTSS